MVESTTEGTIHLLLSDVMMPDMSGRVMAQLLIIEKPFLPVEWVKRVNEILHTPERSQEEDGFDNRIKPKVSGLGA